MKDATFKRYYWAFEIAGGIFGLCLTYFLLYSWDEGQRRYAARHPLPPPVVLRFGEIDVEDTDRHIGEFVTVRGYVYQTSTSRGGNVFLNFGGKYPYQLFSAVWFETNKPPRAKLISFGQKTICVKGKVQKIQGEA